MKNNVYFSNSTLMGDVKFTSTRNLNFDEDGDDTNGDGVPDTNHGWADDGLNVDELNLTLDNGSKWVGQATYTVDTTSRMYDVETNSLTRAQHWKIMHGIVSLVMKFSRAACLT